MTTRHLISLVIGVLILSVLLPVCLSVWLAHRQAEEKFVDDLNHYASRVLIRTTRVVDQGKTALGLLERNHDAPCQHAHLLALRRVAYSLLYIQETLYMDNLQPICSSLEQASNAPPFPPPGRITPDGYKTWLTEHNDLGFKRYMAAMGKGRYVVMIDPDSLIDVIPLSSWPIEVAMVSPDGRIFASNSQLDPEIWQKLRQQKLEPLQHNGFLYVAREVPELHFTIVSWASLAPLKDSWHRQLLFWLPFGALLSLAAALFILRVLSRLQSPRNRLLDALHAREIEVHYQPIVTLSSGKIVGAEALARWPQPDGTFLPPNSFIPLAEQTGLTAQLTRLVIERVFEDMGDWLHHHPDKHISINLAPADLRCKELPPLLATLLNRWRVLPQQIALELTERGFADPTISAPVIAGYRRAGHAVYIDDFGTGYSSLSYLQDLDVDILKIDKSFVDALEYKNVTPHIIEMAKSLGLAMVAEGIETEGQLAWLRKHGVQYGQGWLYSKALAKGEFILWAENNLEPE
ncbi:EAL domain-containing protein [Pseudenterobacter timonensis]|uniref:cyclic-guanylate-specific phosphodiesterase n=1 Tax=Pseudenterobacter timonensis TaxID=1755099 RepID=A0AAE4DQ88_9ENTR|nr:EAL domain-containing protein [Pseudenterobacter timonensis]MDR9891108.1 EAL domain-containing protein [Pseudenterobacter timonensis]